MERLVQFQTVLVFCAGGILLTRAGLVVLHVHV